MNIIDVRAFGVSSGGVIDCGPILQDLIWHLSDGHTLYFPKGYYRTTLPLVTGTKLNWLGDGEGTQLFMDGDQTLLTLFNQAGLRVEKMLLMSNNVNAANSVLALHQIHKSFIDVSVLGGYTALEMCGCVINEVNVHSSTATSGIFSGFVPSSTVKAVSLAVDNQAHIACNANTFICPRIEGAGTGFDISGQGVTAENGGTGETDNKLVGGCIESCGLALSLDGSYQPFTIDGTHMEANGADLVIRRSANITISNSYMGSAANPNNVTLEDSGNVLFENSYVQWLQISDTCTDVQTRRCVVRHTDDASMEGDFQNVDYVQAGSLPYGDSDDLTYGSLPRLIETSNANPTLQEWDAGMPKSYFAEGGAIIASETVIVRSGSTSVRVAPPYVPEAYAGLGYAIPSLRVGQRVAVDVWTYNSASAAALIGVGDTGAWRTGRNSCLSVGWVRHRLHFRYWAGAYKLAIFASLSNAETYPVYVDSVRLMIDPSD